MYLEGDILEGILENSFERRVELARHILSESEHKDGSIVATYDDYSLVVDGDKFYRMSFEHGDDGVELVFEEENVPSIDSVEAHVSNELSAISGGMFDGDELRNRLRELSKLVEGDGSYWLGDIVGSLNECSDDGWSNFYLEHQDEVKSPLKGEIRSAKRRVSSVSYSKYGKTRLSSCGDEFSESLDSMSKLLSQVVDECENLVFDRDDDVYDAIRDSLIEEARTSSVLLGKANKLLLSAVPIEMAEAYDRIAGRAKTMVLVSEYLKKNRSEENQE